jgi:hypothetical protein
MAPWVTVLRMIQRRLLQLLRMFRRLVTACAYKNKHMHYRKTHQFNIYLSLYELMFIDFQF